MPGAHDPTKSRWLELQCPDCGALWYPDMIVPDYKCHAKSCKTHPVCQPYLLNQLELAQQWIQTHVRPTTPPQQS